MEPGITTERPQWTKEDEQREEQTKKALENHLKLPAWQPPQEHQQRLYASSFDLGESISVGGLLKDAKQGREADRLLEIIPISATQAFVIYADNAAAHRLAFTDPYSFLSKNNVDYEYRFESEKHSHITTLTPGRLELEGDKWRMTEKIGVRFDALTPEQRIVQSDEKQIKPTEVEGNLRSSGEIVKPDPKTYEITTLDKERLVTDGLVPSPVYQGFLDNNRTLLPHHHQPIVEALVARYISGDTSLSGDLMQILNSDLDTRNRFQQEHTAAKAAQVVQPTGEAGFIAAVPDPTPIPSQEAITNPSYQPIGITVGTTERADQLSDADSKFGQTVEFRFNPVSHETPLNQPGGSDTEALKVYEQIEATRYELLLPPEAEEIRQFLRNDGYLSNEEISRALYDAGLKRKELQHTVETLDSSKNPDIIAKITDYLWDVHESVMDSPLREHLAPDGKYELVAIIHNPDGLRAQEQPTQNPDDLTRREAEREKGLVSRLLSLKTFDGGMVANMLHNHQMMQEIIEKLLGVHNQPQSQTIMEIPTATRYDWNQIKDQMERNGVTRESLEKSGNLDNLLNGRRTETLQLSRRDEQGAETPVSGRLYIAEVPGKGPVVYLSPERQELKLPVSYQGHVFSKQDQENMLKNGEMGRVVTLKDKITQEPYQAFIGVDPTNKSLTVMRQERFTPPTKLLGAELSPEQREALRNHQVVRVRNMIGDDQKPFTADVQINVNKRSFAFKRVNEQEQKISARQTKKQSPNNTDTLDPKKVHQQVTGSKPDQSNLYLKPLSSKQNEKWLNSKIEVAGKPGQTTLKRVGELTFDDKIMTRNEPSKHYEPLTSKPQANLLQSPAEQARLLLAVEKKPSLLDPIKTAHRKWDVAKPAEIEQAKARYQSQSQTTSIVAKNGQQRISVAKSTASPIQPVVGKSQTQESGKKETLVNGTPIQKQETAKKKKGPKL